MILPRRSRPRGSAQSLVVIASTAISSACWWDTVVVAQLAGASALLKRRKGTVEAAGVMQWIVFCGIEIVLVKCYPNDALLPAKFCGTLACRFQGEDYLLSAGMDRRSE